MMHKGGEKKIKTSKWEVEIIGKEMENREGNVCASL